MGKKAEETTRFIIKKVAPLFNKKGYHGTSMHDIVSVTGLTKGAIYGNFKNKEDLAIAAFNASIRKILSSIGEAMLDCNTAHEKLYAITDFYKDYVHKTQEFGGCVILNKGLNTDFQQEALSKRVKDIVSKLTNNITNIIEEGKNDGSIRKDVNASLMAGRIYGMLNGGVYMSGLLQDQRYLDDIIDQVNKIIYEMKP